MSTAGWTRSDTRRLPALPHIRPGKLRLFATLAVIALVAGLGWLWYRDSSFVKIRRVTVAGLSGPDVPAIRAALERSALAMTTLNVNIGQLDAAVEQYPTVHSLNVTTQGDHAVLIRVNEQVPVALVTNNGESVVVDGYGDLLPQSTVPRGVLPTLPLASAPNGERITATGTLAALQVLQAAPYQWLAHIQTATSNAAHGVILQLRNGPEVYFGPANQLAAKWNALDAVLENSGSAGAQYIDVSDPQRPAAGVNATVTNTTVTPTTTNTTATDGGATADSGGTTADSGATTAGTSSAIP
jgi:cell division protein FtsQ